MLQREIPISFQFLIEHPHKVSYISENENGVLMTIIPGL